MLASNAAATSEPRALAQKGTDVIRCTLVCPYIYRQLWECSELHGSELRCFNKLRIIFKKKLVQLIYGEHYAYADDHISREKVHHVEILLLCV